LSLGALPNTRNSQQETPILELAASDKLDTFQLLMDNGADLLATNESGANILNYALRNKKPNEKIFELALRVCHDLDVEDSSHGTPTFAASRIQGDFLQKLLSEAMSRGADTSVFVNRLHNKLAPLSVALYAGVETTRILLEHHADPLAPPGKSLVLQALECANKHGIKLFNLLWRYGGYKAATVPQEAKKQNAQLFKFYDKWPSVRLLWLSSRKPLADNALSWLSLDLLKIIQSYVTGVDLWGKNEPLKPWVLEKPKSEWLIPL
jgi:hypothetical protein